MYITGIIEYVNGQCNTLAFDALLLKGGIEYIKSHYDNIVFKQHGGTCICFCVGKEYCVKLCKKNNDTLKMFDHYLSISIFNDLTIPTRIMYEDENCVVYEQLTIEEITIITPDIVKQILQSFHKYMSLGFKPSDVSYRNYGLLKGKVYMYDLHDFVALDYDNTLNAKNIFRIFDMLFNKERACKIPNETRYEHYKQGHSLIGKRFVKYLDKLMQNNIPDLNDYVQKIYQDLDGGFQFCHHDYQSVRVLSYASNKIELLGHTQDKYLLAEKIIQKYSDQISTALDAGCSLGGIGCKIAQRNPSMSVMLNNITESELKFAINLAEQSGCKNTSFNDTNLINIDSKYDLTLYFAILHHIFRQATPAEVIAMVKRQTNKYSVIEIPLKGDTLLNLLMNHSNHWNENFYMLEDVQSFSSFLQQNGMEVIEHNPIVYPNSPDLNRHYFVVQMN